eukprot:2372929-Pyramimonas_sp.AAC.1
MDLLLAFRSLYSGGVVGRGCVRGAGVQQPRDDLLRYHRAVQHCRPGDPDVRARRKCVQRHLPKGAAGAFAR